MIPVTKPYLPPKSNYLQFIDGIYDRNWLTNNGPLVNKLELDLKNHLKLDHLLFLSNGTIAIQIAIKALDLQGEVITTPFSYVATTSSLVWENCTPVFVDINPGTLTIDPSKIEAAITERTTGILATHVYGNPCDIAAIAAIAERHQLKVIYDAAHCFGTRYQGRSVLEYGDVSTISFHATKLFHTVEGGAVVSTSAELTQRMARLRNFGHDGPEHFEGVGINGKNSEFHAAMGLAILPHVEEILQRRKTQHQYYRQKLQNLRVEYPQVLAGAEPNYAYFPIVFPTEAQLLRSVQELNHNYIYPRRYFYPSLNRLGYLTQTQDCPVSESIAARVLCLPLYHELTESEIELICRILLRVQNYH